MGNGQSPKSTWYNLKPRPNRGHPSPRNRMQIILAEPLGQQTNFTLDPNRRAKLSPYDQRYENRVTTSEWPPWVNSRVTMVSGDPPLPSKNLESEKREENSSNLPSLTWNL
jgi:hypothetical protein